MATSRSLAANQQRFVLKIHIKKIYYLMYRLNKIIIIVTGLYGGRFLKHFSESGKRSHFYVGKAIE